MAFASLRPRDVPRSLDGKGIRIDPNSYLCDLRAVGHHKMVGMSFDSVFPEDDFAFPENIDAAKELLEIRETPHRGRSVSKLSRADGKSLWTDMQGSTCKVP